MFSGYFIFGDNATDIYKNLGFILVNVLSASYRGSLDKIDFDISSDRHAKFNTGFFK